MLGEDGPLQVYMPTSAACSLVVYVGRKEHCECGLRTFGHGEEKAVGEAVENVSRL